MTSPYLIRHRRSLTQAQHDIEQARFAASVAELCTEIRAHRAKHPVHMPTGKTWLDEDKIETDRQGQVYVNGMEDGVS